MQRVYIIAEGQTEERFINELVAPNFYSRNLYLQAILLTTKRPKNRSLKERRQSGRVFKGGVTTYNALRHDVRQTLNDKDAWVTTMVDYYGLPKTTPGVDSLPRTTDAYERVTHLEQAIKADIDNHRFRPFIMLHEFEALLFCDPNAIANAFLDENALLPQLQSISNTYASPEEINDGPETHPSARLEKIVPRYRKTVHGPLITGRIGLQNIRQQCRHFNEWIKWLETLTETP